MQTIDEKVLQKKKHLFQVTSLTRLVIEMPEWKHVEEIADESLTGDLYDFICKNNIRHDLKGCLCVVSMDVTMSTADFEKVRLWLQERGYLKGGD